MSAKEVEDSQVDDVAVADGGEEEAAERLNLDVQIASPSACERHVTVTVSREDVDRYLDEAYSELMASASVWTRPTSSMTEDMASENLVVASSMMAAERSRDWDEALARISLK